MNGNCERPIRMECRVESSARVRVSPVECDAVRVSERAKKRFDVGWCDAMRGRVNEEETTTNNQQESTRDCCRAALFSFVFLFFFFCSFLIPRYAMSSIVSAPVEPLPDIYRARYAHLIAAYGEATFQRMRAANVLVVGAGGIGQTDSAARAHSVALHATVLVVVHCESVVECTLEAQCSASR